MKIEDLRELLEEIDTLEREREMARSELAGLRVDCWSVFELWFGKDANALRCISMDNLIAHMHRELPGLRASQERRRELELEKDPEWQP